MRRLFKSERDDKNLLRRLRNALELTVDVDLKKIVVCDLNSQERGMFNLFGRSIFFFRYVCEHSVKRHYCK
jgi:hypothetical protein